MLKRNKIVENRIKPRKIRKKILGAPKTQPQLYKDIICTNENVIIQI